jgi:HPt (histidine-containing phosphotransfer) domain-containing protein
MGVASSFEGLDGAAAAQFETLRRQFVAGLLRRQHEIEAAPDTAALHAALHRLAGAAGSYGYTALGQMACTALRAMKAGEQADLAASLRRLQQEIDVLMS